MADLIAHVADIIEPHIEAKFLRRHHAEGNARDLAAAGLLGFGTREQVVNQLQCRQSWMVAERIADALHAAGLIKE